MKLSVGRIFALFCIINFSNTNSMHNSNSQMRRNIFADNFQQNLRSHQDLFAEAFGEPDSFDPASEEFKEDADFAFYQATLDDLKSLIQSLDTREKEDTKIQKLSEKLSCLTDQISQIQLELSESEKARKSKLGKQSNLRSLIYRHTEEIKKLSLEKNELNKKDKNLGDLNNYLNNQNLTLKENRATIEKKRKELTLNREKIEKEIKSLKRQKDLETKDLEEIIKKIDYCGTQEIVDRMLSPETPKVLKNYGLLQNKTKVMLKVDDLSFRDTMHFYHYYSAIQSMLDSYNRTQKNINKSLSEIGVKLSSLNKSLSNFSNEATTLKKNLQDINAKINKNTASISENKKRRNEIKNELAAKDQKILTLSNSIQADKIEIQNLEDELKSIREKIKMEKEKLNPLLSQAKKTKEQILKSTTLKEKAEMEIDTFTK